MISSSGPAGASRRALADLRHVTTYAITAGRTGWGTGVETHVNEFTAYARECGMDVRRLTAHDAPLLPFYPYFAAGRLMKPLSPSLWIACRQHSHYRASLAVLRSRLPPASRAVVYAQDGVCARAAVDARDAGLPAEVVFAVHYNGSEADDLAASGLIRARGRLYERIRARERRLLARVDRVIFPSRFVAEQWHGRGRMREGASSYCIPNFAFDAPPAPPALAHLNGDLVTIGCLDPRKNHEFLLRVLAAASRRGHRYRLTIAGDGPLAAPLRATAARLGVAASVTFAGLVPSAASLLRQHRVYVHASRLENCPIALVEAMAAGRPVLAAPAGGVPELMSDGEQGLYWNLDDEEDAAAKLIHVLEHPEVHARMSAAARRRYESRFTPEVVGPRLLGAVLGTDVVGREIA